ncbi:MAG: hypothetical protein Q7L55_13170 [Actinomycetota bacterium]|nr:hypothetical protein [Actinomycetota bacterium]
MSVKDRPTSAAQKLTALGIASATCVGLVGVVAVRNAQGADAVATSAIEPSTTLTQAQLDANAAQLLAAQQRLDAYRQQLADAAKATATPPPTAARRAPSTTSSSNALKASKKAAGQKAAAKKARAAARAARAEQQRLLQQQQQQQQQLQQMQQQQLQQQLQQQATQGRTRASR